MKLRSVLATFMMITLFAAPSFANGWGVRVAPLSLLLGLVDAEVDIAVTDQIVVVPSFTTWNLGISGWSIGMTGFGVGGTYHFDKAFADGWYAGGFIRSLSMNLSYTSGAERGTGSSSTTAMGLNGGYLWQWDSFYMNLGIAYSSASTSKMTITTNVGTQEQSMPAFSGAGLDWKMGFSF